MIILDMILLSVVFCHALEFLIHAKLFQKPTSDKKACAISSSIVGQPTWDTVLGKLGRGGLTDSSVADDRGIHNLADDPFVGEANNETIFRTVVLVLCLLDHVTALLVI